MDICTYCHKPIEDLNEGDLPYHVECAVGDILKRQGKPVEIAPQENSDSI